jgi:pantetheine-phosphate adenylyltransferase
MTKNAIYPGSFDPFTLGHKDIAERALKVFDHLYIAIGSNSTKKALFTAEERMSQIKEIYKESDRVSIVLFDSLLADLARKLKTKIIIRGLRAVSDFDIEFQMALANRKLDPELESIFFMTSYKYAFLSSSIIKEIAFMKGTGLDEFVPPNVQKELIRKFQ